MFTRKLYEKKIYRYDVACIGNAIVDIFHVMSNEELEKQNIVPGSMHLITKAKAAKFDKFLAHAQIIAGSSAANTAIGIASFGGKACFIGKTLDDLAGRKFKQNLAKHGVKFAGTQSKSGAPTAKSFIMMAPDGKERTMLTYLGIATTLQSKDIDEEVIKHSKILFLEGYLWDSASTQRAAMHAMDIATKHGVTIAFSLSDILCVKRHKAIFSKLISTKIDILFGNKNEIFSMFKSSNVEGLTSEKRIKNKILVLTLGSQGSVIIAGNKAYKIKPNKAEKIVDTTGAGDLFASGILYGLSHNLDLKSCGALGNLAAAENIGHIGGSPNVPLKTMLK